MNKKFNELLVTLIVTYLALVFLIGVAVYSIVRIYCLDITLTTNILIWTATLFAPIVILATYNSWKEQKGNEIVSQEAIKIAKNLNSLLDLHRKLFWFTPFKNPNYIHSLIKFEETYEQMFNDLTFLKDAIENIYEIDEFTEFEKAQDKYLKSMYILKEKIISANTIDEYKTIALVGNMDFDEILEEYSQNHYNIYQFLLRISMYKNFKKMNLKVVGSQL